MASESSWYSPLGSCYQSIWLAYEIDLLSALFIHLFNIYWTSELVQEC